MNDKRPELVNNAINNILTGTKMYEYIAAFSLYLDYLSWKEMEIVNNRFYGVFQIRKKEGEEPYIELVRKKSDAKESLIGLIENDNKQRKSEGKELIKYNPERIY